MGSNVDGAIQRLRGFVAAWPAGVALLEDAAVDSAVFWQWVINSPADRARAAQAYAPQLSAWRHQTHALDDLHAVAALKGVTLPKSYVEFMTRYGSLTLVPTDLRTSPLDGLCKPSICAESIPCLLQLLPASEVRRVHNQPNKLMLIGAVAGTEDNWLVFLQWQGSKCVIRACAQRLLPEGEGAFMPQDLGPFDAWLDSVLNVVTTGVAARLAASEERAVASQGFAPKLSQLPAFERATKGKKGNQLVDATVAALRQVVNEHPGALVLVEALDLEPKQSHRRIEAALGTSLDEHFLAYHVARIGAWQRPEGKNAAGIAALERVAKQLPPSYRYFLQRYGSLSLLGNRLSHWVDGFWSGNVGSNGWALLEILDAASAAEMTRYIRSFAKQADCDLGHLLVMHGGWMHRGFALHLETVDKHGECAVQHVSDEEIGAYEFKKLPRRERVAPNFATWFAQETARVIGALETALVRVEGSSAPR